MEILSRIHSGLRWIVLILLLAALFHSLTGMSGNKPFNRKLSLFAMISVHTQLLVGLILYFVFLSNMPVSFSESMHDPLMRYFTVEHVAGMLVGIIFITIGNMRAKRADTDKKKHKAIVIFYTIGLLVILLMIPWPFRAKFASLGWF